MTLFNQQKIRDPGRDPSQEQQDLSLAMGPPPQPPKKKGLFSGGIKLDMGSHKKEDVGASNQDADALAQEMNNVSRRTRLIEDRTQNMRQKLQLLDQNVFEMHKKLLTEIKTSNDDIKEIKHQLQEMENNIIMLIKELRMSAKKEDVDVMTKYIELWQPQTFVSREQVEKIIREIVEEYIH